MFTSRIPFRATLALLVGACFAGAIGCGASHEKAASAPGDDLPAELVQRNDQDSEPAPSRQSGVEYRPIATPTDNAQPLPEAIASPIVRESEQPDLAGSEPPSPAPVPMIPRMSVRSFNSNSEPSVAMPRMMAPLAAAPTPESAPMLRSEAASSTMASDTIQPRMAEAPIAPSTITIEPHSMAMEAAASPETAEAMPVAAREPVAEDRGDYSAVTVFFGTDRSSTATSGKPEQPHQLWLYVAGVCLLLFGLFALVARTGSRKRTFAGLAVVSFAVGAVAAVVGTIAWQQSDGAIAGPKLEYGNGRGAFVMGTCEVSIPRNHQVAELEAPSVFKLDFVENPTKHVVLMDIEEKDSQTFFSQLQERVNRSDAKDAFVFVHGFNVTFEDAARRTAQLAYDLKFQGAPIFYSWPSQGGLFQYTIDENNVVWTVPHLRQFLKDVAQQSGAKSVHLIAHSMGNRALTGALRELAYELRDAPPLFHEVVLTAPDIDAEVFRRDIAPAIVGTARRVTLYASSNDEALMLSKQVHGYPRAGESGPGLVVIPGVETVDVSTVDTSLLGHNYYGDNATVISDMLELVKNSRSARERSWLETASLNNLLYWVFRADRGTIGTGPTETPLRY